MTPRTPSWGLRDRLLARLGEIRDARSACCCGYCAPLGTLVEGMVEEVGRHEYEVVETATAWARCLGCPAPASLIPATADCQFVLRWSAMLGVA